MQRDIFDSDHALLRDARVQTIHGGTNEIMNDIVGRSLGL